MKLLHEAYGGGVRVLAVNVYEGERAAVEEFVRDLELPYTVLMHGDEVYRATYRGRSIPQTYLIDPHGKIVYAHGGWGGDADRKKLEAQIGKLLPD